MMTNCPRAPAIPARRAEPYPRAGTLTTRAPSFSAMSVEPSVEPLSATTTSPRKPADLNASSALPTQIPIELASLRHGMTTETSTGFSAASGDDDENAVAFDLMVSVVVNSGSQSIRNRAQRSAAFLCNFRGHDY